VRLGEARRLGKAHGLTRAVGRATTHGEVACAHVCIARPPAHRALRTDFSASRGGDGCAAQAHTAAVAVARRCSSHRLCRARATSIWLVEAEEQWKCRRDTEGSPLDAPWLSRWVGCMSWQVPVQVHHHRRCRYVPRTWEHGQVWEERAVCAAVGRLFTCHARTWGGHKPACWRHVPQVIRPACSEGLGLPGGRLDSEPAHGHPLCHTGLGLNTEVPMGTTGEMRRGESRRGRIRRKKRTAQH
jgi:hypothetical protein